MILTKKLTFHTGIIKNQTKQKQSNINYSKILRTQEINI